MWASNVRAKTVGQISDLVATVDRVRRWAFLVLREVARDSEEPQVLKLKDGHIVYVGPAAPGAFEVAMVVHRNWVQTVGEFWHVDRLVWLVCRARGCEGSHRWVAGSAYLPHRGKTEEEFECSLAALEDAMGKYGKRAMKLWGVDGNVELCVHKDLPLEARWR